MLERSSFTTTLRFCSKMRFIPNWSWPFSTHRRKKILGIHRSLRKYNEYKIACQCHNYPACFRWRKACFFARLPWNNCSNPSINEKIFYCTFVQRKERELCSAGSKSGHKISEWFFSKPLICFIPFGWFRRPQDSLYLEVVIYVIKTMVIHQCLTFLYSPK